MTPLLLAMIALASLQGDAPTTLREAAARDGMDFGTAVEPRYLSEPTYPDILASQFSVIEPENAMKFEQIHPRPDTDPSPYDFGPADQLANFARDHHQKLRGHCLLWYRQLPAWVTNQTMTPPQMAETLHHHIRTVMHHFAGRVFAWDVVNEAFVDDGTLRSSAWYDKPGIGFAGQGTGYIEQAFRWAREADPKAKLFYNDFSGELFNPKSNAIYAMLKDFKTRGVPVDGIGFQCHLWSGFDTPANLNAFRENLQRFADLGLIIHITELDLQLRSDSAEAFQAEANLYRDVAKVASSQSHCKLIQTWGFTDKHSWISNPAMGTGWGLPWDASYQKKPAWYAIIEGLERK
jgi:endo-1,4-beta-xylanase